MQCCTIHTHKRNSKPYFDIYNVEHWHWYKRSILFSVTNINKSPSKLRVMQGWVLHDTALPPNATPWNTILNCCFTAVVSSLTCRPSIRLSAKSWLIITDWLVIYLKLNINNWSAPKLRSPVCLWGRFPRRRSGGGHGRGAAAGGLSVAPPSPATTAEARDSGAVSEVVNSGLNSQHLF